MINLRKANLSEYLKVRTFYHTLIDMMENATYKPAWEKEIYPADDYLIDALQTQTLYIGFLNDEPEAEIICAMIVNHECNDSYADAKWDVNALPEEITVIHTLGVMPTHFGKGIATEMVNYVIELARSSGQRSVRLDVLAGNLPAERLYSDIGFKHITTLPMYYEDTGWTDFLLYEYLL